MRLDDIEARVSARLPYPEATLLREPYSDLRALVAFVREIQSLHVPNENCFHNGRHCCLECELFWPCATRKAFDRLNGG